MFYIVYLGKVLSFEGFHNSAGPFISSGSEKLTFDNNNFMLKCKEKMVH